MLLRTHNMRLAPSRLSLSQCSIYSHVSLMLFPAIHKTWDVAIPVASIHVHVQLHTSLYFKIICCEPQLLIKSDNFVRCSNFRDENHDTLADHDESWKRCRTLGTPRSNTAPWEDFRTLGKCLPITLSTLRNCGTYHGNVWWFVW